MNIFGSSSSAASSLAPPTTAQLASMSAIAAVPGGRSSKKHKVITKLYDLSGVRPSSFQMSPNQQITVAMEIEPRTLFTSSTLTPQYTAYASLLTEFLGYTQYTALFDQYRIELLEAFIEPLGASGTTVPPPHAFSVDYDDDNTPTSFASVADRQGAVVSAGFNGTYLKWTPHAATALFSGAFTSYGSVASPWIDCASPSVRHYGIKGAMNTAPVALPYVLSLRARVSFRGPGL